MSIIIVNSATKYGATSPMVVNAPANCQAGDVLIAQFFVNGTGAGFTLPDGWTRIAADQAGGATNKVLRAWHIFAAGETSYSWTWTGPRASCGIMAFRGVDNLNPVAVVNSGQGTSETTITVTSITTTINGSMLVFLMAPILSTGFQTVSNELLGGSTAMTEQYDINQSSTLTLCGNAGAYYLQDTAGASGNATATIMQVGQRWFGTLLALTPLVTGTGAGTLAALTGAGVGAHGVAGTGAGQIAPVYGEATGHVESGEVVTGTGEGVIAPLTGLALGAHGVAGAGAATLPVLVADGYILTGSGEPSIRRLKVAGEIRTFQLPGESRVLLLEGENRFLKVTREDRILSVEAEERTLRMVA